MFSILIPIALQCCVLFFLHLSCIVFLLFTSVPTNKMCCSYTSSSAVQCPNPPAIVNGMRIFTGNSVGDVATYTCNTNFELIGNATTVCRQIDVNIAAFAAVPPPECRREYLHEYK